jgi:hypothetical protein
MQEGPEPLYDLQQLAAIAPFNQRQLRRYIKSGRLVAGKLGEGRSAKWVVRAGDWETFVEESFRAQSQVPDAGVQPRGARAATKTACRVVRRARAPKRARGAPPPLGSLESLRARSGLASAWSSAAAAHDAPQSPSHVHLDRAAGEQLRCQVGDGPGRPLRLQPGKKGDRSGRSSLCGSDDLVGSAIGESHMRFLGIDLDLLTPAERRDLANALLRAAWSAALEDTRVLLLDLLLEVDEAALGGAA